MQRDTAVAIVLVLFALLAIGAAAATLENPAAASPGSGVGSGSDGGIGTGSGSDSSSNSNNNSRDGMQEFQRQVSGACMAILQTLQAKLLIAGGVAALAGYVWWRTDSFGMGVVTAVLSGSVASVMWFALAGCLTLRERTAPRQPPNQTGPDQGTGGGSLGAAAETAVSQPSTLLLVVLTILVVAAIVVLYVASDDDVVEAAIQDDPSEEEAEELQPDIAAVGRLAGEAADRIETGDSFDNEVFRAWVEMTEHLAVKHPESSTPAEFATAAVDAGMDPDDVNELTDLFEEVRYGDHAVTAERESRATEALRRIEAGYAGEGEE